MYLLFLLVLRYRKKVCLTKVKQTFSEKNSAFSEILRFYEFLTSRKEFIRSVCIAQKFIFISVKLVIFWVSSSKKSWLGKYIIIKKTCWDIFFYCLCEVWDFVSFNFEFLSFWVLEFLKFQKNSKFSLWIFEFLSFLVFEFLSFRVFEFLNF